MSNGVQALLATLTFDHAGLIPVVVQDFRTGEVLMVAYMNAQTLEQTLETGTMTYWSRSRKEIWVKGATSGHIQRVKEVRVDCDGDALLFKVDQVGGAACHTGHRSCFYRVVEEGRLVTYETRVFDPDDVYRRGEAEDTPSR